MASSLLLAAATNGCPSSATSNVPDAKLVARTGAAARLLAVDDTNVFWTNLPIDVDASSSQPLYATSKNGGANVALADVLAEVNAIGVDGTTLYFPVDGTIASVPITSGSVRTLATGVATAGVTVANGNVYWFEDTDQITGNAANVMMSVPTSGGAPSSETLPAGHAGPKARATFADGDAVYGAYTGFVSRVPFDATKPATYFDLSEAFLWVQDANAIYAAETAAQPGSRSETTVLVVVPKDGTAQTTLLSREGIGGVAVDDAFVYFSDTIAGDIEKIARTGGTSAVIATQQAGPTDLLLDRESVYWVCAGDGTIRSTPK